MQEQLKTAMDALHIAIEQSAEAIKQDPRVADLGKLLQSLNTLEDLAGTPRTRLASVLNFATDQEQGGTQVTAKTIRPDEFYGLDPLESAKRYLRKVGRSARFPEIVAGIRAGGGDTGPEDKLRVSLARSTFEIAKIGDDFFGLLEFYPHIKRERKKKRNGKGPDGGLSETDVLDLDEGDESESPDAATSGEESTKGGSESDAPSVA